MVYLNNKIVGSNINNGILATLAYFDVFDYPLTADEIFKFLGSTCSASELELSLKELGKSRKIYKFDDLYMLKNNHELINRRKKGNALAYEMLKTARKISRILIRFPYVRGVAVSGSLSKNYADENSDIDLFIITSANRLWIARTVMHLFKKLTFLVNKQNFFCMNYYIDEQGLEIIEKNIYTATEIATLIPMEGKKKFEEFYAANAWIAGYLPNSSTPISDTTDREISWFNRLIELSLNNRIGDDLDNKFKGITSKRWAKKTQLNKLNMRGIVMSMKADKHYSKPDPSSFQTKLVSAYENKVLQITQDPVTVT